MVDPISNAPKSREIGPALRRSQASSRRADGAPTAGLAPDHRVAGLEGADETLIEETLRRNFSSAKARGKKDKSFPFEMPDAIAEEASPHWPPAQLLLLRNYIEDLQGLILDTQA